ncbi:hypothetical protein [Sarcina ventriculi]
MDKAWLVRPKPHTINRINEFKSNKIIAIGWPLIGDLTKKSRLELKRILQQSPYNLTGHKLGKDASIINIFINKMNINDLVLIPDGDDIYLGEIVSDYIYVPNKDNNHEGYPHQRNIDILNVPISRSTLPDTLKKSFRNPSTIANLDKHYAIIKQLIP